MGFHKNGNDYNLDFSDNSYNFKSDSYLNNIIELLEINSKKYLNKKNDYVNLHKFNLNDFKIPTINFNSKEVNNAIIKTYIVTEFKIEIDNEYISKESQNKLIKHKLICNFISEILNEPLFDRIRTIDKLGYIVKADYKVIIKNNNANK